MAIEDLVKKTLNSVEGIEAIAVYTADGKLVYATEGWTGGEDGKNGINAWNSDADEFVLGGDKYIVLRKDEEVLVATHSEKGPLLLSKSETGKYVIFAKLRPGAEMGLIRVELSDLAYKIEKA